jgi:hypothetical protein
MENQLFTDGIGKITVIGGVVRLDLVTYSPTETDAQGRPLPVFTQRIVMGTEAFLRSSEKIAEMVQQITGAIAAQQQAPATAQRPMPVQAVPMQPVPPQPAPSSEALVPAPPPKAPFP